MRADDGQLISEGLGRGAAREPRAPVTARRLPGGSRCVSGMPAAAGAAADDPPLTRDSLPGGAAADDPPLTRAVLRREAFGTATLPRTLPKVERLIDRGRFPYAAHVDRLTVPLAFGFSSVAYDLRPRHWNGRTLIWHNGHVEEVDARSHVLRWFLARNWRLVTIAMPLAGENAHPGYDKAGGLHDGLATLARPLEMFLLPVVALVNYTGAAVMSGLSGGGWTTVAAARSTRASAARTR